MHPLELVLQASVVWQIDRVTFHLQAMLYSFQVIEVEAKEPHMFPLFHIILEDPVAMYHMILSRNLLQVTHTDLRNSLLQ